MNDFLSDIKLYSEKIKEFELSQLNDIDWSNIGSWPFFGKLVFSLLIFLFAFICAYFYFWEIDKTINRLNIEQKNENKLKEEFERKFLRVANLDQYKTQMKEMEKNFDTLLKQLPRDTEVPGLIDDISSAALSSGLKLNVLDPRLIEKTPFYDELPIDIEVMGNYHEMGAFVSSVASLPRIVTLHDFSIKRDSTSTLLTMNILSKTYQYAGATDVK